MAEQIRLLVIEDVPQVAMHMRSLLNAQSQIKMLDVITSGEQALAAVNELRPDVLIVDALLQGRVSGMQVAEQVRRTESSVSVIVLTVPQNPVAEDPAAGIDAVLKMPFSGFDLTTMVRKVHEQSNVAGGHNASTIISLFSPKGGVGRTTLAFNLAVALGVDRRVCLIDGSLQFSDLRGLLRAPAAAPSIMNLPTDRIRDTDLADVVWKDPSGIDVLLAPPRIEMAEMVTVRDIEKALSIIRQVYEVIVVDTRPALSDDVLAFLDASDLILEVLAYDSMAIRALAMADEAFATIGYAPSKLEAVLNRSDSTGGFTKANVEEALNRRIEHEVVSDGKLVITANNEGVPFVLANPDAPVSQGIKAIAASIAARLPASASVLARR
ncbi:MAG TPA: response regulator [Candidatus Limnocylindria bacterium]|nr:response regulator [Candidatus Limnocylindria bacterium]